MNLKIEEKVKCETTICLNMIVRDEAHIIEKTLTNIC